MAKHGKKYREALEKIDRDKQYEPVEALALAKETSFTKFDITLNYISAWVLTLAMPTNKYVMLLFLPHGLGKTVHVLVFAQGEGAAIAREAGADYVADDDEMIKKIQGGWTDFDVAIATPDMMGTVGRLGRFLALWFDANPKAGTVVPAEDLPRVIDESKAGRVEFRVDKTANLHIPIGKVSFEVDQLRDNMAALMDAIKKARPAASKGTYIRKVVLAPQWALESKLIQLKHRRWSKNRLI